MRELVVSRFIISSAPIGISKSFDKYYLDSWALLTDYIRVIYGKFLMQTQSNALWIELVASIEFLWLCGAERTDWPVVGIFKENSASLRDVKSSSNIQYLPFRTWPGVDGQEWRTLSDRQERRALSDRGPARDVLNQGVWTGSDFCTRGFPINGQLSATSGQ